MGALDIVTGEIIHCLGLYKSGALFLQLLQLLDRYCPTEFSHLYLVVDNYTIHKTKAVSDWLADHPRFELLFLPSYCPQSNLLSGLLVMPMIKLPTIINVLSWPS